MKTTKLLLSIALVTLTVVAFGKTIDTDDIKFETELTMENWMSDPFDSMDNDLIVESWMANPFSSPSSEEGLSFEKWMTTPFGLDAEHDVLALESWMTTPFEATYVNCPDALLAAACD